MDYYELEKVLMNYEHYRPNSVTITYKDGKKVKGWARKFNHNNKSILMVINDRDDHFVDIENVEDVEIHGIT